MNVNRCVAMVAALSMLAPAAAAAQAVEADAALQIAFLKAQPTSILVRAGESTALDVTAHDADGILLETAPLRFAFPRAALWVSDGRVHGTVAGDYEVVAAVVLPPDAGRSPPSVRIPVRVLWPEVARVELEQEAGTMYAGTTIRHFAAAYHADGSLRPAPEVRWSSSSPEVADVDPFGFVTARRPGEVTITAEVDGTRGTIGHVITPFPADALVIGGGRASARTGDVIQFAARATDAAGAPVEDLPVTWSFRYIVPEEIRAPGGPAQIDSNGRFVADLPGHYQVLATAGPLTARQTFEVEPRDVIREIEVVGHGRVNHVRTSDHWIWEGRDGRDYAITGTWVANGWAYIWDVSDPGSIAKTDSIWTDARTVNDVKVSPDGRYAVMTREGASTRRNGVVILDLEDPAHPTIASTPEDGLTGGVHNTWPTNDYLYAVSGGDKYVILDVRDIYDPKYVGEYNHPNSRIHDLWVSDGIAYSAEWNNGIVAVDVGNGRWGGSPETPVFINNYITPGGHTHTVVPYLQQSTGRLLVFASDEVMNRRGMALAGGFDRDQYDPQTGLGGRPMHTSGYTHIVDFTDPEAPRMIAKYHVPEYGTHNMWIEDDILYQGYFESGVRAVDVSGDLMGNLYTQGREIAAFKPFDPEGWIPNAAFTWGAMVHKGYIYFTDGHSGLWAARLKPKDDRPTT